MDDERVWHFEDSLWTADAERYRALVDEACVMVLPTPPFIHSGAQAIEAVAATPRWTSVDLTGRTISRPEEGLIVVGYRARASRGDERYEAHCTSTYRRRGHEDWQVVQHQQTPPVTVATRA